MGKDSLPSLTKLNKIVRIFRLYPLPIFAFLGLLAGVILYFSEHIVLARFIWLFVLILGGAPIVFQTIKKMFKGEFASDIVAMLAIITALIMKESFAGAVVVLMQSGGEALEAFGLSRATRSLKNLIDRAPRFALRKKGAGVEKIDVKEVEIGDILVVRPGDLIPVDGTIVQGEVEIDESSLTGEPLTKSKKEGDVVYSGTIDQNGAFEMRSDKTAQESQYQKIVELVQKAQLGKAPIQRLADQYAIFFTPLTLFMGVVAYWMTKDATNILSVLVVATPCPLILATPLAILCGINRSAQNGIIVKGGAPLEQIGRVKSVIFDKTGTITYGSPFVQKVVSLNEESIKEILFKAACIEQLSSHSIAKALVAKVSEPLILPQDFREFPGRGVEAKIGADSYALGSEVFLKERCGTQCFEKNFDQIIEAQAEETLLIYMAKNCVCIGAFFISDQIRPEAFSVIEKLHAIGGMDVLLLTGDHRKNAELIAKQAGILQVQAEVLPQDKVEAVQQIKHKHPVAMVGDGINDAPALASATVGIAMGSHGSAISAEAADIVLLEDDLNKVFDVVIISKRTLRIAKQSIFIGMGLSFTLMVVACFGKIEPAVGALLQEMIDFAVILNALRAVRTSDSFEHEKDLRQNYF